MAASVPPKTTSAAVGCHNARVGAPSRSCASRTTAIAAGRPTIVAYSNREGRRLLIPVGFRSRASSSRCKRSSDRHDAPKFRFPGPVVHASGDVLHECQIVVRIDRDPHIRTPQPDRGGNLHRVKTFPIATNPGRDMFPVCHVGGQCGYPNQGVDRDALNSTAVRQTVFDHVIGMCGPECREHAARPADVDRWIVACGANNELARPTTARQARNASRRRRQVRETTRRRTSRPLPPAHRLPDSSSWRERPARRLQCAAAPGNGR